MNGSASMTADLRTVLDVLYDARKTDGLTVAQVTAALTATPTTNDINEVLLQGVRQGVFLIDYETLTYAYNPNMLRINGANKRLFANDLCCWGIRGVGTYCTDTQNSSCNDCPDGKGMTTGA